MTEGDIAVAACERDLAEWEECLSACEADLKMRAMQAGRHESPVAVSLFDVDDQSRLAELQELRTNPAAFEGDRQRLQTWLETLQKERAVLQQEREKLAAERERIAERTRQAMEDTVNMSLPATIAATISTGPPPRPAACEPSSNEPGPIGMEWHQPRRDLEKSRLRLNSLHVVANHSARKAIAPLLEAAAIDDRAQSGPRRDVVRARRRDVLAPRCDGVVVQRIDLGAAAIGLITFSGLVHTWTEFSRLNAGARPRASEPRETAETESAGLLSGV